MDLGVLEKKLAGNGTADETTETETPFAALAEALGIPEDKRAAAESALAAYIADYYDDGDDDE